MNPASQTAGTAASRSHGGLAVLTGLSCAHGIFHFMYQSFAIMLPAIRETFGISPVQIGALITAKEFAAGVSSLPGGLLSDRLRHYRGLIMAACMAIFALSWLLIGFSPVYALLIVGMVISSIAGSVWHLPSMVEISHRFSSRRGAALAIHGIGGSFGDVCGPVITGFLLSILAWRGVISIYAMVPLLMAFWVIWAFSAFGRAQDSEETDPGKDRDFKTQLNITRNILRNPTIWQVNLVAGMRGMCYNIYVTFLPLYMQEGLGFSSQSIGIHFGLLWSVGILASPFMGHLSDRYGRKLILVPALLCSCTLTVMLALFGKGAMFTVIICLLGFSLRSDYALLSATLLDIVGKEVATTMLGLLSLIRFILAAISPLIAGFLYQSLGMSATLFFVAALFAVSAMIFCAADLKRANPSVHS